MLTDILKKCGRGVLYIITLPILLVVLSIYAVIGVIQFFYVGIKSIWYFFTGRNLFGEFPEDVKAREILEGKEVTNINIVNEPVETPTPSQPYITTPQPYITKPEDDNNGVTIISSEDEEK
ncbi:MAG: hypothetical protein E7181_01385 [Erysipelotrichaceae bacterium]|nr:hypothetical protein [Erysipelotrichaceae bacterium]